MSKNKNLFSKTLNCPVCKNSFKALKVKSRGAKVIRRDSDLCAYFDDTNPYFYNISICPECGYAAIQEKFDYISSKNKEIILEKITPNWKKRDVNQERSIVNAINSHKIALYQATIINEEKQYIGLLSMFLAWLYRYKQDIKNEKIFLKYALINFKEAYSKESFTEAFPIEKCAYLIGEILNTFKKFNEAIKWYNIALSYSKKNPSFTRQIREQWQSVSSNRRKQESSPGEPA